MRSTLLAAAFMGLAVGLLPGQMVGSPLPDSALTGLANTEAKSFGEYQGRLVIAEFFAYW